MAAASPVLQCSPEKNVEGSEPHSTGSSSILMSWSDDKEESESEGLEVQCVGSLRTLSEERCSELVKTALSVDREVMRGVSLKVGLRRLGRLWRLSPADLPVQERSALWALSKPVESFDIFLSHSWRTKGRWKVVALSLRFGWRLFVGFWLMGILIVELLCLQGLLPMKGSYEVRWGDMVKSVPFGAWGSLANLLSFLAFLIWPYIPDACGGNFTCFLDVASINQVDAEIMERGIYGLGGFLAASNKLLILWSEPYLTRLWCVFELAAYRTANPKGKITLAPLFVENGVANIFWSTHIFMILYLAFVQVFPERGFLALGLAIMPPSYWCVHRLRSAMRTKRELFTQMSAFKLESVECREDFDRQYIHGAIVSWYGSHQAFEEFVRGPLRQDLLLSEADTQLPVAYVLIIVSPFVSLGIDILVGILRTSLPLESAISFFFGAVLGTLLCWNMVVWFFALHLCSVFAGASSSSLKDHGLSLLVLCAFLFVALGGLFVGRSSYSQSLAASLLWFFAATVCLWLASGGLRRVLQICHRRAPTPAKQPSESCSGTENKEVILTVPEAEICKDPVAEEEMWEAGHSEWL